MSLVMTELNDDVSHAPDPTFNPKVFSEDEEEEKNICTEKNFTSHSSGNPPTGAIPIAPMTPRREENRSRLLNSILSMADGNGNHFFRSPRFVYTNPSLLRERAELRKALINSSKNGKSPPTTSDSQEENSDRDTKYNSQASASPFHNQPGTLGTKSGIDRSVPSSSKTQPSLTATDRNISNTYHNDLLRSVRRMNDESDIDSPIEKKEFEDIDFNLSDVINFCETLKIGDVGQRKASLKIRQEKNETSFLNNQMNSMSFKTQDLKSPKNGITPYCISCDGETLSHPSTDFTVQNIHMIKNVIGKRYHQEKLNGENTNEEKNSLIDKMSRSCSVGYLDDVDTGLIPCELSLKLLQKDSPKRLVLVGGHKKTNPCKQPCKTKSSLKVCGKSRSLDSEEFLLNNRTFVNGKSIDAEKKSESKPFEKNKTETIMYGAQETIGKSDKNKKVKENENVGVNLPEITSEPLPPPSPRLPRSQPVTPAMGKKKRNQSASPIR